MTYGEISGAVERLRKRYGETDPFRLCRALDIILLFRSLGEAPDAIKGFFLESKRIRTITINDDLPAVLQKIIAAHELGHAVLHRKSGLHAFHEVGLFDDSTAMERESNLFAAELLLDDEAVLETLNADNTFFSATAALYVPTELLDFKFRVMKWKGYKLTEPPVLSRSNFLRDLEVSRDADAEC